MSSGRVVLIGAVHESLAALRALATHPTADLVRVVTLTPEAASKTSGVVDLGGVASGLGLEVAYVDDVNRPEVVADIRACRPDLIVVVGWTRLIHDELLALPSRGCVGFHASLLPRHRGRAPVNWSIIRGETETGNTMMLLDRGTDTGLIIDQRRTPISVDDTCASVYERIADLGAEMLTANVEALLAGTAVLRPQDHDAADVLPKRTPAMGITDWMRSASEIHDWIRALTAPYPGAFTHLDHHQVMLWSSRPPSQGGSLHSRGEPGEIIEVESEGMWVATGDGTILIDEVGDAGASAMDARDWCELRGITPGARFEIPSRDTVAWSLGLGPRPEGAAA